MRNFIGDNINALRINKGCSQAKFAKISGVSQSSISAWERGESVPQSHHVQAIIDAFPDLIPDDILSEKLGYAKRLILSPYIRKEDVIDIPLFGSIAAGKPIEMLTCEERYALPVSIYDQHKDAFYLKVEGESMNRVLPNGSFALIDPNLREAHDGKVYAVSIDNSDATIKRVHILNNKEGFELRPDSFDPSFEPIVFKNSDQIPHTLRVIGQVVWYTMPYGKEL
ncbi:MAG TPA: XRE family transcriptional regulator [Eggerthellaceae bacterium]|nr:XRE family transcriptional regulator [Eggerthellaceae bacterium]